MSIPEPLVVTFVLIALGVLAEVLSRNPHARPASARALYQAASVALVAAAVTIIIYTWSA